jgi:hypothetical protein
MFQEHATGVISAEKEKEMRATHVKRLTFFSSVMLNVRVVLMCGFQALEKGQKNYHVNLWDSVLNILTAKYMSCSLSSSQDVHPNVRLGPGTNRSLP